ncbi:unnamed protein product [Rotaria socialis]
MYNQSNHVEDYEQSLKQARVSLLGSTFDQLWMQSEQSSLIEHKASIKKTQSSWYHDRKSQISIILLIIIIILLLLFSLPFIIRSQYLSNLFLHQCSSLACLSTSHRIIENLNMNKNPCENFYSYACDGWINSHFLTPSETSISYFKEIYKNNLIILYKILKEKSNTNAISIKKLKTYFHSCMNTSNDEDLARSTLKNILHHAGPSLLLLRNWSRKDFNLVTSLTYTHRHKINPLFHISITTNHKNNNYHCIYLEQSGLSFEERLRYNDENIRYLFNNFGTNLIKHLHSFLPTDEISKQIDEIFLFEKRLASIFQFKNSYNPLEVYHTRTYEQIQQWFSSWFDIENYFERIFRRDKIFFYNQTFLISTPDYFEKLKQIMQTTPRYILANYITFQVIQELLPNMPESFNQFRGSLMMHLKGIVEEKQLWEICVKRTDDAFGFATGALFISRVFDRKSQEKIKHIVEEIRLAFIETLPNIKWMDSETRHQAQMKAQMIIDRLGYPKWLEDERNIDRFYEDLNLSSTNNPIDNIMLVRRFQKEHNLKKLGQRPDIEEWTMTPLDVNAYYAPWKNMIVFPAGILQTPFFDANIPISLNFGSIASIIGHELIHAFDASGRYFDGHGNLNNWWQKGSARSFDEHAQCFIDQYNQYRIGNKHINGLLTLDENIADNGGLRIAYVAYENYLKHHHLPSIKSFKNHQQQLLPGVNLTDEQLFFIGFAQTWCTKTTPEMARAALVTDAHAHSKYRVIGSLSNMPEFSRAFKCAMGSPMHPEKRCQICKTLPREIVTINGQETIICLSCAEKQYSSGKFSSLSYIRSNIKYNKVLALLNRTFRTLYELNESNNEPKDHIEVKKQAIKEGVLTCLTLLRPSIRENQQITPTIEGKKKIIITKKYYNVLDNDSDDTDKENLSNTPILDTNKIRRKTIRTSKPSKRPGSSKQDDEEEEDASPSKRKKKAENADVPLPIISPNVVKKVTPNRTKTDELGEEKKKNSIRLARKVHQVKQDSKSIETTKLTKQQKQEINTEQETEVPITLVKKLQTNEKSIANRSKPILANKASAGVRNDKGETLLHQAVKKGDIARVKQLIDEEHHPVNTIDNNSWTPLHEASAMGNIPLMELLLANNANINIQGGQEQMTVLHEAVSNENLNETVIKFLLENGADPLIKNKAGKTVLELVTELANHTISSLFEKNHCVHPSHNELPIAPPPRRRVRTISSSNILFLTGFNKTRKESFIKSMQTIFGRKCVTIARNVENNVTHVIACGETDRVAFRTINYLRGIVLGKWIVSEKWIEECIKEKRWINENDYEVLGSQLEPSSNGCHISRIKHEQNEILLFNKCEFFLYGQFHTYKKEDIADLVKITGATLLKREPKLHRINSDTDLNNSNQSIMTYIIYESSVPDILLDNNVIKHIKLLDFLACIDYYNTQERLDN